MAHSSGHRNGEGQASDCPPHSTAEGAGAYIQCHIYAIASKQAAHLGSMRELGYLKYRAAVHWNREGHASVCASLRCGGDRCIHATSHLCPCQPATTKRTSGHTTKLTVWNRAHDTGPCLGVHCIALRWWSVRRQHMQQASLEDGSIQRMMSRQCSSGLLKLNQCNPF